MFGELLELYKLTRRRRWPQWRTDAYQDALLRGIVSYAYENVPYHRSILDGAGLKPRDIRGLRDLKRVPVTTKEACRRAPFSDLVSRSVDITRCPKVTTSGSTGIPVTVCYTRDEWWRRAGVLFRGRLDCGCGYLDRSLYVGPLRQLHRKRYQMF